MIGPSIVTCYRCGAGTEFHTDGRGHVVEMVKECRCPPVSLASPHALTDTCPEPGCGRPKRPNAKRCTRCGSQENNRRRARDHRTAAHG